MPFLATAAKSATATGAWPVLMMMSSSSGVTVGSADVISARYWM